MSPLPLRVEISIRGLLYGAQFESPLTDGVDDVADAVRRGDVLTLTPEQARQDIAEALASTYPLRTVLPELPHTEAQVREFLTRLHARLGDGTPSTP